MFGRINNKNLSICLAIGCLALTGQASQQSHPFAVKPSRAVNTVQVENNCQTRSMKAEIMLVNICLGYEGNGAIDRHNPCCVQIQQNYR